MTSRRNEPLYHMFTAVPLRYDLVNRVVTWGLDKWWRRQAARECLASQPGRALDLCCGTGDLLLNLAQLTDNRVELVGLLDSRAEAASLSDIIYYN